MQGTDHVVTGCYWKYKTHILNGEHKGQLHKCQNIPKLHVCAIIFVKGLCYLTTPS